MVESIEKEKKNSRSLSAYASTTATTIKYPPARTITKKRCNGAQAYASILVCAVSLSLVGNNEKNSEMKQVLLKNGHGVVVRELRREGREAKKQKKNEKYTKQADVKKKTRKSEKGLCASHAKVFTACEDASRKGRMEAKRRVQKSKLRRAGGKVANKKQL